MTYWIALLFVHVNCVYYKMGKPCQSSIYAGYLYVISVNCFLNGAFANVYITILFKRVCFL